MNYLDISVQNLGNTVGTETTSIMPRKSAFLGALLGRTGGALAEDIRADAGTAPNSCGTLMDNSSYSRVHMPCTAHECQRSHIGVNLTGKLQILASACVVLYHCRQDLPQKNVRQK